MTPSRYTRQHVIARTTLTVALVGLTAALAIAQQPVAPARPAPPAKPAPAAQPAPPAAPAPAARPAPRPLPSRSVKLEVTLTPVFETVAGTPRVVTVTMAEGRYARFRRLGGQSEFNHLSLDATSMIANDREVLVEFNLDANASDRPEVKEIPNPAHRSFGIAQEGSVLLTPGVKQRVTQVDDSGGRPSLLVEMLVEIVK